MRIAYRIDQNKKQWLIINPINENGYRGWLWHRDNGFPARIYKNGLMEHYIRGEYVKKEIVV